LRGSAFSLRKVNTRPKRALSVEATYPFLMKSTSERLDRIDRMIANFMRR